jgi:hopene-associated glycosyltransferase HpnB
MFMASLILGVLCLAAWLYLLLAHGSFWGVSASLSEVVPARQGSATVAVVIPARDEADVIGETIESLLQQTYSGAMQLFVVDDQSSDETSEAATVAAHVCGRGDSVTVIDGQALPLGWTGKLWAVQQGIERALRINPEFLLLTDADIVHDRDSVATLLALAEQGPYDLTSFMVKLHCRGIAEKLLIPAFVFFFFMLYPPQWIRNTRRKVAGAAGGCMLIRREALRRVGGIEAIRDQIIDDCALAAKVKGTGGRVWLGLTSNTFSTRSYGSFAAIERMIARTAFNQLKHSFLLLMGAILGLALVYLVPLALLATGSPMFTALGVLCWLMMAATYYPMVKFYRLGFLWALTLPASASFYMFATVHSAVKFWSGDGGEWKGRAQDRL